MRRVRASGKDAKSEFGPRAVRLAATEKVNDILELATTSRNRTEGDPSEKPNAAFLIRNGAEYENAAECSSKLEGFENTATVNEKFVKGNKDQNEGKSATRVTGGENMYIETVVRESSEALK
ncbi:unnamed protein product [Toxocara canis]|uniref:Uncharacterized protein n=1 Tax=Toxocara canis TaxID=6265 RepID=A0A183U9F1_TOXCA|nr:unnamed protein product [Toxocara canis]